MDARAASVSSNWAGYTVTARGGATARFRRVTGSWTQPAANCTAGQRAYSAFWVGLGGYSETSQALEQVGTEADCNGRSRAAYSVWYELVPSAPVTLRMRVAPGDRIAAAVAASGHRVTVAIRDLTSRRSFRAVRRVSTADVSSAEWIAEAPSDCQSVSSCQQLPLTNFGSVSFSDASATTTGGHTGAIGDSRWAAHALEMHDNGVGSGSARLAAGAQAADAVPQGLSGSGFQIGWQAASVSDRPPAGAFPRLVRPTPGA